MKITVDSKGSQVEVSELDMNGWHIETCGSGKWVVISWVKHMADAVDIVKHMMVSGAWKGVPPRIVAGRMTGW